MADKEPIRVRLRHYTRLSSKDRILSEGHIIAGDQNKVFVEKADRKPLGPREAEEKYLLKPGKGNAFVEFDALPEEVRAQMNRLTGNTELYLRGDVDLVERHPQGFENH
jgi:hypothetical protein